MQHHHKHHWRAILAAATIMLLFSTGLLAQSGGWTDITGQTAVSAGTGIYDGINRQYLATVRVTNSSGASLAGQLRLVVASSNMRVNSPDGVTGASEPFFSLVGEGATLAAGDSITRNLSFARGRGRLSYTTRVEQQTLAPTEITGTISGTVTDTQTGAAIADVSITLGTATVETSSGTQGTYTGDFGDAEVSSSPERGDYVTVTAEKEGYTDFQTQVSVTGAGRVYSVDFSMAPVAASVEVADPSTEPVDLPATDNGTQTGQLDIPAASVLDDRGNPVSEPVRVDFTPIDPTDPADLAAFPGADFVAAGGDPNDPTTLDSVVLAEIRVTGESGTEYSDLAVPATIELLLPDDLQAENAVGDSIPTWYYDETSGLWVEEGSAVVQLCSFDASKKCALFSVDHFTWWNVDRPISAHACFKGTITQLDGTTPVTVPVRAAGVTYNGTSSGNRDYADPAFYGVSFKRSGQDGPPEPEQVKLFLDKDGQQQYLTNPVSLGTDTYQYDLTLDANAASVFDSPNFSGSTIPNPDSGICQTLNIRVDFNLAPVVSLTGPGVSQTPGSTVTLNAVVTDADGNYNPPSPGGEFAWSVSGCSATLSNQTANSANLTGSGGNEDCVVTLTATDDKAASGSDSELVRFSSGGFVPGDQLRVRVLNDRGQPLGVPTGAFLSDPAGNPITTVSCDPNDDGACPMDPDTGLIDFGAGFAGGPVDLTVAADLGFAPGEELPIKRLITFRGIPSGSLTLVVPGETFDQVIIGSVRRPRNLLAELLFGKMANAAILIGSYDFGVILDYVTPPGSSDYETILRAGIQEDLLYPVSETTNQFNVSISEPELELGGLTAFIGFGLDTSLPGSDDREKIRYGFAVDQNPAAYDVLGSNSELRFDLDKTAGLFDITGPYAQEEGNRVLAWRSGVSYRIDCDDPLATRIPPQVTLCDQFPSARYFHVAQGTEAPSPLETFDSQAFSALPTAPGPIGTDALEATVELSNGVIDPTSSSVDVNLGGAELGQIDMLRTDFRAYGIQFETLVWTIFQAPSGAAVAVSTPLLPATLAPFTPAFAYGDCEFEGGAPTITAMALRQQSTTDFYTMVQNARLMGDYKPIAPESTGVFFPEVWPDALWLITADRLQGVAGEQCLPWEGFDST